MAIGWSGSNGGIDEQNRLMTIKDIDAGIGKYRAWIDISKNKGTIELFQKIVSCLEKLRIDIGSLEEKQKC